MTKPKASQKHSPLPWKILDFPIHNHPGGMKPGITYSPTGFQLEITHCPSLEPGEVGSYDSIARISDVSTDRTTKDWQNAQLIVRAVNSHEADKARLEVAEEMAKSIINHLNIDATCPVCFEHGVDNHKSRCPAVLARKFQAISTAGSVLPPASAMSVKRR